MQTVVLKPKSSIRKRGLQIKALSMLKYEKGTWPKNKSCLYLMKNVLFET